MARKDLFHYLKCIVARFDRIRIASRGLPFNEASSSCPKNEAVMSSCRTSRTKTIWPFKVASWAKIANAMERDRPPRGRKSVQPRPIVLFDGICNLCNASVRAIVANDPGDRFRFAALESPAARIALAAFDRTPESFESIVLIDAGGLSERTDAALRIACSLRWPWPLLGALFAVPRGVRDRVYLWIARNRYRVFGKTDRCRLPTPELQDRFL